MAGKRHKLKLSPTDETYDGKEIQGNQLVNTTFNKREQEMAILVNFLMACELEKKDEIVRNIETIHRIDNTEHGEFLEVDEEEVKWFRNGMEKMASQRNISWVKCREIIRQINEPEEVGVKVVEKEE